MVIKEQGFLELLETVELPLAYLLGVIELNGVYIDKEILGSLLEPEMQKREEVYICGPEKLRRSCINMLKELGFSAASIHFEKFSS